MNTNKWQTFKEKTDEEALLAAQRFFNLSEDALELNFVQHSSTGAFFGIGKKSAILEARPSLVVEVSEGVSESDDVTLPFSHTVTVVAEYEDHLDVQTVETKVDPETAEVQEKVEEVRITKVSSGSVLRPIEETEVEELEAVEDEVSEGSSREKVDYQAQAEAAKTFGIDFLKKIVDFYEVDAEVLVEERKRSLDFKIKGEDCGILIGRRGSTLQALTYIFSQIIRQQTGCSKRISIDIGDYYAKKRNSLEYLAKKTAKKALETGNAYELNPMTSSERRLVHEILQDFEGIVTYSEGDEPERYVVIDLVEEDDE